MVHGGDFVAVGDTKATYGLRRSLETSYKVKCEILGGGRDELGEIRVLNRIIQRDGLGFALKADARQAEIVVRDLGLAGAKPSKRLGSKEEHKRSAGGPAGAGVYPLDMDHFGQ